MMVQGFISIVKLALFPGSTIKPAIMNQDIVENRFSQLRVLMGKMTTRPTKLQKLHRIPSYLAKCLSTRRATLAVPKTTHSRISQNISLSWGGGGDNNELPTPQTFSLLT